MSTGQHQDPAEHKLQKEERNLRRRKRRKKRKQRQRLLDSDKNQTSRQDRAKVHSSSMSNNNNNIQRNNINNSYNRFLEDEEDDETLLDILKDWFINQMGTTNKKSTPTPTVSPSPSRSTLSITADVGAEQGTTLGTTPTLSPTTNAPPMLPSPPTSMTKEPPPRQENSSGGGNNGTSTAIDGTLTILVLLTVIFCFVWSPSLIRRCDPRYQERRRLRSAARAARRAAEEAAIAAVMAGDSDALPPVLPHGMSEEDRRDYVSNVLVTKKVVTSSVSRKNKDSSSLQQPYSLGRNKSDLVITPSSVIESLPAEAPSSQAQQQYSDDSCAICLTEYEEGDEICWSHNTECNHAFHRECILEWLIRHDDCPCCRHNYLSLDDNDEEGNNGGENVDANNNNSNNNNNNTGGGGNDGGTGDGGEYSRLSIQAAMFQRNLLPSFLFSNNYRSRQESQTAAPPDRSVELATTTTGITTATPPPATTSTTTTTFSNETQDVNNSGESNDTGDTTESNNAIVDQSNTDISPPRARFLARLRFVQRDDGNEIGTTDNAHQATENNMNGGAEDDEQGSPDVDGFANVEDLSSRQQIQVEETNESGATETEGMNIAVDDSVPGAIEGS